MGDDNWVAAVAKTTLLSCNSPFVDDGKALNDEGEIEDKNGVNSSGWTSVIIVVIIGLLLIAAANVVFCVYMKRKMMIKHNMEKVMDENEVEMNEEIEVQCTLETSDTKH